MFGAALSEEFRMPQRLTDADIELLLREPKQLPADYRELLQMRVQNRSKRANLDLRGAEGGEFRIFLRQAELNHLDFSVVLAYEWKTTGKLMILRRYNGLSHEHENVLEKQPPFYDYHIHTATERYQRSGFKEEHYAVPTDRYNDIPGAYSCLIADCGFEVAPDEQTELLDRGVL
jgi:hypothetical protein